MIKRLVFLDVDGVLNSAAWTRTRGDHGLGEPGFGEATKLERLERRFDPGAILRLNQLLDRSGAEIVLSSSWRKLGLELMRPLFATLGVGAPIIDRTPLPSEHDERLFERLLGPNDTKYRSGWPRGFEIQQWLDDYDGDIDHLVILDDSWTMKHLEPWQVRTSVADGLCDHHVELALEILDRPAPKRARSRPEEGKGGGEPSGGGDEPGRATTEHAETSQDAAGRGAGRATGRATGRAMGHGAGRSLVDQVAARLRELDGEQALPCPAGGTRTPARWRAYFGALDHWWRWAELGRAAESEGDPVEANLCFAAATWLQSESAEIMIARVRARRDPSLAERVCCQPDPSFPELDSDQRHRRAWELGGELVELPTLIRWSCDPNPSVRASIYRALARTAHPAVFQTLQEGLGDPEPGARLAAVEALGRCCDPTCVHALVHLRDEAEAAPLQRAISAALERISSYWDALGEQDWEGARSGWDYVPPSPGEPRDAGVHGVELTGAGRTADGQTTFESRRLARAIGRGDVDDRRARVLQWVRGL